MKKTIIIPILVMLSMSMYAQQDSQFTQYMYNTINVNPAYAGSRGVMSIFGVHRAQWMGLEGAPSTTAISAHTPLPKNTGLGVNILQDAIGPSNENHIALDFSYTVHFSEKTKLSFGLKGSMNLINIDYSKLNVYDPTDPRVSSSQVDNKFSPNVGAGIYLHGGKGYLGVSVPQFIETEHFDKQSIVSSTTYMATERLHYYILGGYVFNLSDNIKFKPAALTKITLGAPLQLDVSANFMINEKFVAGLAYRMDAAVSALFGFQVNDQIFIGYSYDADTTSMFSNNIGSQELFLRYELFRDYGRVVSPRFF